jgi:hypothetical protein
MELKEIPNQKSWFFLKHNWQKSCLLYWKERRLERHCTNIYKFIQKEQKPQQHHLKKPEIKCAILPPLPTGRLILDFSGCVGVDFLPSKILAFLLFHTSQHTRMMIERSPRFAIDGVQSKLCHQDCIESLLAPRRGRRCSFPNHIVMPS